MVVVMINDIFLDNLPKIDLHGYDRESARVMVNDFVDEAVMMGYSSVVIIHGIGSGILRMAVKEALDKNKKVLSHHVDGMNNGCTVVKIRG